MSIIRKSSREINYSLENYTMLCSIDYEANAATNYVSFADVSHYLFFYGIFFVSLYC